MYGIQIHPKAISSFSIVKKISNQNVVICYKSKEVKKTVKIIQMGVNKNAPPELISSRLCVISSHPFERKRYVYMLKNMCDIFTLSQNQSYISQVVL